MSDFTQELERGVGEFASERQGGESNNNNNNNNNSGMRSEERAPMQESSNAGFGGGAGSGAGAGGTEGTADTFINKGRDAHGEFFDLGARGLTRGWRVAVDTVASEEGVPGMADGMLNKKVDGEVNQFL